MEEVKTINRGYLTASMASFLVKNILKVLLTGEKKQLNNSRSLDLTKSNVHRVSYV